jgi:hypothetical protein
MTRDHITDILGQRVEVGDRVAAACTTYKSARLVVGRVERITAARTVIRPEARAPRAWSEGSPSVVDDSLGRVVKLPEEATA